MSLKLEKQMLAFFSGCQWSISKFDFTCSAITVSGLFARVKIKKLINKRNFLIFQQINKFYLFF